MKNYQMAVFIIIVLAVYFLTNYYIFNKGYKIFPAVGSVRLIYSIAFIIMAATFILGKFLERNNSSVFTDILNIIGGFWLAFMLYGFLLLVLSDLIIIINKLFHFIPSSSIMSLRKWAFLSSVIISSLAIIIGFIIAITPIVRTYNITINKQVVGTNSIRIAAVSDIHLGSIIRKRSMNILSKMLTDLKPDLTLFLGDIVDGEIGPVLRSDLLSGFKCPDCKSGVYVITGNHEYIGGAYRTIPYIESKGFRVLKDEVVTLPQGIQLVGRLDRDSFRFSGKDRLPLDELMKNVDKTKPVILLDHQPFNLDQSEKNSVDLQLSGHTHKGQMWPLTYIVKKIYEVSYGYKRKGNTHVIVSSGFGVWGPRIRLGSRSEVLLINLTFSGTQE